MTHDVGFLDVDGQPKLPVIMIMIMIMIMVKKRTYLTLIGFSESLQRQWKKIQS